MTTQNKVLVLTNSYEPLSITSIRKAFLLVYTGKADVVDFSSETIKSVSEEYTIPSIIKLKIRPRYNPFVSVELNRKNIFRRDNYTCQYCSSTESLTIDHVIPKSKGGKSTWENLVTACMRCNNKKDNKSLHEVGMTLKIEPRRLNYVHFLSKKKSISENWKPYLFLH